MHARRTLILGTWVLTLAAAALPGSAAATPVTGGITRAEMAEHLQTLGYEIKLEADWKGLDIIKTNAVGVNFDVYFLDCDGGRCQSIQFAAGWTTTNKPSPDAVNAWNRDKRFIRAYLTEDGGALYGEMDLHVAPASSTEQIDEYLRLWKVMLPDFKTRFSL